MRIVDTNPSRAVRCALLALAMGLPAVAGSESSAAHHGKGSALATNPAEIAVDYFIQAKLLASDGNGFDFFGQSVAVSGDRIVVGASNHGHGTGSAYVYDWDGIQWVETQLLASDGAGADFFGRAVAVCGDRIVVGATGSRSAYVYDWDGAQWVETKLRASDGGQFDAFGERVAASGDRVVVGVWNADSAYVYDRDGVQWVETKLRASDGSGADFFGQSVAVSGDRIVVGAGQDDDNGNASGSAYVYDWDGAQWVETKLLASDGAASDEFGSSVSMSADRIVVGAPGGDYNRNGSGAAYVYDRDGSQWTETKLIASDWAATDRFSDEFGSWVAVSGDRIVVGAPEDDDNGRDSGSAYVYDRDGGQWTETKLIASDGAELDHFGYSVAVSGDRIVVGVPNDDDNHNLSGSAYVFQAIESIAIGVSAAGVRPALASCRNRETGQAVAALVAGLAGGSSWDCTAAGLDVLPGKRIVQILFGTASE